MQTEPFSALAVAKQPRLTYLSLWKRNDMPGNIQTIKASVESEMKKATLASVVSCGGFVRGRGKLPEKL